MTISTVHISPTSVALREGAAENPTMVALEVDERLITYGDLNEQADRLANRLVAELGAEERIALRLAGTHEFAVGSIAVHRAGMVTVPLEPAAPPARVRTVLSDVEPALLLSDVDGDEALGWPVAHPLGFGAEADATPVERGLGELVSIVYTSGSTGTPKGVMQTREQLPAVFHWFPDFGFGPGSRYGCIVAGNPFHPQLRLTLEMRGTLVAYEIRRHGLAGLGPWLVHGGLIATAMVPTVLRYLLPTLSADQQFSSLRVVALFGETLTWEDVAGLRRHLPPEALIVNSLGLTEASGFARLIIPSDMLLGEGPVPVGTVSEGVEVAILDPDGRSLPACGQGHIVVRGKPVALGYWRRPELTSATFRQLEDGRRELRTGDAGRLLSDGTLVHLGRLDHMVKISGNRVELGEVEQALICLDAVGAGAVAAYPDDTQTTRLAACVVPAGDRPVDPRALRAALSRRLPGYMVPHRIAIVHELPRLPGGKVDRLQIAAICASTSQRADSPEAVAGELEGSLQAIWQEILQVDHVNRDDDFFQIGGDSMRADRMFVELERRLGIDRPVSLLAEAPTIASLALMLGDNESAWEALVAFRTEGTQTPLFVIHDGEGGLLNARGLAAELNDDRPIYGLRAEGMKGIPPTEKSIPELAASYIRKVQALYPHGPYLFYGASFGGMVSIEMASQLIKAGEPVPFVAMGDTRCPHPPQLLRRLGASERVLSHHSAMKKMSTSERVHHLSTVGRRIVRRRIRGELSASWAEAQARAQVLKRAIEHGEPIPAAVRLHYVRRMYGGLMPDEWEPRPPFPRRVLLLRTGGPRRHPDRRWGPILGSRLEIVDVPGRHSDLGREWSAPYVAPVLRAALSRAAVATGAPEPNERS